MLLTKQSNEIKAEFPTFIDANDLQNMGFSRSMAYQLLNSDQIPVLKIGRRKYINRDKFFEWTENIVQTEVDK